MFKFLAGRGGAIIGLLVSIGAAVHNYPDAVGHGVADVAGTVVAVLGTVLTAVGAPVHKATSDGK